MRAIILGSLSLVAAALPTPASAQRAETTTRAIVSIKDTCALTPETVLKKDRASTKELFGPVIGGILAAVAGDLVKTGVTAVGSALEVASREQGFVAEGEGTFLAGQIDIEQSQAIAPNPPLAKKATFKPGERCLHLFVPGPDTVTDFLADPQLVAHKKALELLEDTPDSIARAKVVSARLKDMGVGGPPMLYAEVALFPGSEGYVARPTLVWYREKLSGGAPKGLAATELHLLLATPSYDAAKPGIGTAFAAARIAMPKIAPKSFYLGDALAGASSVTLPLRPTSGYIDTNVQALNTAIAAAGTAKGALRQAQSAQRAAQRLVARDGKPEAKEALTLANEAVAEAERTLAAAERAIADPESTPAGATNAQARLVIVRDEKKFGMALAKALKGQAEAAGTAAKEALAPAPAWVAGDTAYITALNDVEAKQTAYDAAVAQGDAAATLTTGHALRQSKAKANEAAVASKRPIPYPGLLD